MEDYLNKNPAVSDGILLYRRSDSNRHEGLPSRDFKFFALRREMQSVSRVYPVSCVLNCYLIMLIGAALFLQWLVNNYMSPAEPIGFLMCLISVLLGITVLGAWMWGRSK